MVKKVIGLKKLGVSTNFNSFILLVIVGLLLTSCGPRTTNTILVQDLSQEKTESSPPVVLADKTNEALHNYPPIKKPEVMISNSETYQGDYFSIYVENTEEKDSVIVRWRPYNKIPNFYNYKEGKITYIPVNYRTIPGQYTCIVEVHREDEIIHERSFEVTVKKKDFITEYLVVTRQQQSLYSSSNLQDDSWKIVAARKTTAPEPLWQGTFIKPVEGRITSDFGDTRYINNVESSKHSGIDIGAKTGTPIKATNDGIIKMAQTLIVTGECVIIDHGLNLFSLYGHMHKIYVKEGDFVKKGDVIGEVGSTGFSTGPHLHWGISIGGIYISPWLFMEEDPLDRVSRY